MADEVDWTPKPGRLVDADEAAIVIAAFEKKFRIHTAGRDPKTPTWCTFDPATSSRKDRRILRSKRFRTDAPLFLYFEGGRALRETTMSAIRRFLDALQPWEDWDMYIFDAGLDWCVAITHMQMGNRVLVIAAGEV